MWFSLFKGAVSTLLFGQLVSGAAIPSCNTASDRSCWVNGFNISTDYEANTPFTGVTQSVSLSILTPTILIAPVHLNCHRSEQLGRR